MKTICPYLHYIPSTPEPLSADVYVIEGDRSSYIFDVGNNQEAADLLSTLPGKKTIILSHPHNDHIGNIGKLDCTDLYVGDATYEKIQQGTVVSEPVRICDGVEIKIMPCPSPHTGGSLIVTVNNEYTLLADLYFTRPPFDRKLAREMLAVLRELDTKHFVVSHQEETCVFEKDCLLRELSDYFNQ